MYVNTYIHRYILTYILVYVRLHLHLFYPEYEGQEFPSNTSYQFIKLLYITLQKTVILKIALLAYSVMKHRL
jgi:hypothetical protein